MGDRVTGRTHKLKTWPGPYDAIVSGSKRYEVRNDDRGFAVGDTLDLREWVPDFIAYATGGARGYTGCGIRVLVTHKTPGGKWGLPGGLCVLGIRALSPAEIANPTTDEGASDDER